MKIIGHWKYYYVGINLIGYLFLMIEWVQSQVSGYAIWAGTFIFVFYSIYILRNPVIIINEKVIVLKYLFSIRTIERKGIKGIKDNMFLGGANLIYENERIPIQLNPFRQILYSFITTDEYSQKIFSCIKLDDD